MEDWTTKISPSYLNWLKGLLPERRLPLVSGILQQLREMEMGSKKVDAYFQLARLKPTVVLQHLSSEKLVNISQRSTSSSKSDKKKNKLGKLKNISQQSTLSSRLDKKKNKLEKFKNISQQSTSSSKPDSKKNKFEKLVKNTQRSTWSSKPDEKKNKFEKLVNFTQRSTSSSKPDEKTNKSEKLVNITQRSTSSSKSDEKKNKSEKLLNISQRSTSSSKSDEKKNKSEKLLNITQRSTSSSKADEKKNKGILEHAFPSKENDQGGTPRSNVDYTRNTPSLTLSEINHRWEDLHMTPPRKAASPFWKETPVESKICTVSSHATDMTCTSGVLKEEEPSRPTSISPNFELVRKVKIERNVLAVEPRPPLSDGSLVELKEESYKLTPVTFSLVKPQTVKQEPDRKPVLLKLVPDVSDRKPVLLKLVPDVSESKPNILFEKESERSELSYRLVGKKEPSESGDNIQSQMECTSSEDLIDIFQVKKQHVSCHKMQAFGHLSPIYKLVPDVSDSKRNLFEKESEGPELSDSLVAKKEPSASGDNIQSQMECTSSEDPIDTFQVIKQHVSCQKMHAFRHLSSKYKIDQKSLVQFDPKNWSKSILLKILTKEDLIYQSEVEDHVLNCLSFCARFGTVDETSSVSTVQAHRSSRLSSVSTVLNEANQSSRQSVASMTTVANHQSLRHSVGSVATVANRSHHPHLAYRSTNYSNPRYYTQPYPRNWFRERYSRRGYYPRYM